MNQFQQIRKAFKYFLSFCLFLIIFQSQGISQAESDTLIASVWMSEAKVLQDSAKHEEALVLLQNSLKTYQTVLGEEHLRVADIWDYIGVCNSRRYDLKEAEIAFDKALEIKQQVIQSEEHISIAESYYFQATLIFQKGEYTAAHKKFIHALKLYEALGEENVLKGKIHNSLGNILKEKGQYQEALKHYEEAIKIIKSILGPDDFIISAIYNGKANAYSNMGDYEQALESYQKALDIQLEVHGAEHIRTANFYNNLGILYNNKGNYEQALKNHNQALAIRLNVLPANHPLLGYSYMNLGAVFANLLNYQRALDHHQEALRIFKSNLGENHPLTANTYQSIGNQLSKQGHFELSLENLQKAIEISQKINSSSYQIARFYSNFGNVYEKAGDLEKALEYTTKAYNIYLKNKNEYPREISMSYASLSSINQANGLYKEALFYRDKAIQTLELKVDTTHSLLISNFLKKSQIYQEMGSLKEALKYCKIALKKLNWEGRVSEFEDNIITLPLLFEALRVQVEIYALLYKAEKNDHYKTNTLEAYESALEVYKILKSSYQTPSERQTFLSASYQFFDGAIANYLYFHQQDGSFDHLQSAFEFSEESKSLNLILALQGKQERKFNGVPDEKLQEEKDLLIDIKFYEKQCFLEEEKGEDANQELINQWKSNLFDAKEAYRQLKAELEQTYPAYRKWKKGNPIPNLKTIQKTFLNKNEALLEFFIGDSAIYIFHIQKNQIGLQELKKDFPLQEWINKMRAGIFTYWIMPERPDSLYLSSNEDYSIYAHQLYQKLLEPLPISLPEKIYIIPDGILALLPFDALLKQAVNGIDDFKTLPYFIKEHQVSYLYSATIQHEINNRTQKKYDKPLLTFAPSFDLESSTEVKKVDEIRNTLGPLKFNIPESQIIQQILGGDLFTGQQATKTAFLEAINENYQVIHLATHAKSNDLIGNYSFIAFASELDSINKPERLFMQELYNCDISSEMVVLSACETGLGELRRGEGIVNLALGFTHAGVNSVVSTLWNVNDLASKNLMTSFYQNLKDGLTKDAALRHAKLNYIEEAPIAAPYFWSGVILSGDTSPLNSGSSNWFKWSMIIIAISIGSWWLIRQKKL